MLKPKFIVDSNGKKLGVILSLKEYRFALQKLDELGDIRKYSEVKTKRSRHKDFEQALKKEKNKKSPAKSCRVT